MSFWPVEVLAVTSPLGLIDPNDSGDENGKRREKNSLCTSSPHPPLASKHMGQFSDCLWVHVVLIF